MLVLALQFSRDGCERASAASADARGRCRAGAVERLEVRRRRERERRRAEGTARATPSKRNSDASDVRAPVVPDARVSPKGRTLAVEIECPSAD